MLEAIDKISKGIINPSPIVTHIGGLDAVIDTTKNLPKIGGKSLYIRKYQCRLRFRFQGAGKTDKMFLIWQTLLRKTMVYGVLKLKNIY